jgi:hypothetical protein
VVTSSASLFVYPLVINSQPTHVNGLQAHNNNSPLSPAQGYGAELQRTDLENVHTPAEYILLRVFFGGLFYSAFSVADYIASNGRMTFE